MGGRKREGGREGEREGGREGEREERKRGRDGGREGGMKEGRERGRETMAISVYRCATDSNCIIGHFLCTFGPITIFMFALPIFYCSTLQKSRPTSPAGSLDSLYLVEKMFKEGVVIEVRKREKEAAKKKVSVFILVFYFW